METDGKLKELTGHLIDKANLLNKIIIDGDFEAIFRCIDDIEVILEDIAEHVSNEIIKKN